MKKQFFILILLFLKTFLLSAQISIPIVSDKSKHSLVELNPPIIFITYGKPTDIGRYFFYYRLLIQQIDGSNNIIIEKIHGKSSENPGTRIEKRISFSERDLAEALDKNLFDISVEEGSSKVKFIKWVSKNQFIMQIKNFVADKETGRFERKDFLFTIVDASQNEMQIHSEEYQMPRKTSSLSAQISIPIESDKSKHPLVELNPPIIFITDGESTLLNEYFFYYSLLIQEFDESNRIIIEKIQGKSDENPRRRIEKRIYFSGRDLAKALDKNLFEISFGESSSEVKFIKWVSKNQFIMQIKNFVADKETGRIVRKDFLFTIVDASQNEMQLNSEEYSMPRKTL